jgi:hypothetical protein
MIKKTLVFALGILCGTIVLIGCGKVSKCFGSRQAVAIENKNEDFDLVINYNGAEQLDSIDFDNLRYFQISILNSPYSPEIKMFVIKHIFFSYDSKRLQAEGKNLSSSQIRQIFGDSPNELRIDSLSVMDNRGTVFTLALNKKIAIRYPIFDDYRCLDYFGEVYMKELIRQNQNEFLKIDVPISQFWVALNFAHFGSQYSVLVRSKNGVEIWTKRLFYDTNTVDNICVVNNLDTLKVEIFGDYVWSGKLIFERK